MLQEQKGAARLREEALGEVLRIRDEAATLARLAQRLQLEGQALVQSHSISIRTWSTGIRGALGIENQ